MYFNSILAVTDSNVFGISYFITMVLLVVVLEYLDSPRRHEPKENLCLVVLRNGEIEVYSDTSLTIKTIDYDNIGIFDEDILIPYKFRELIDEADLFGYVDFEN